MSKKQGRKTVAPTGSRERLHRLVDALPAGEVRAAARFLEYLRHAGSDSLYHRLVSAPLDGEPVTPAEEEAIKEGLADLQAGRSISHEELKRELDLA